MLARLLRRRLRRHDRNQVPRRNRPAEPLVAHLTSAGRKLAGRHFEAGQKLDIALIASSAALADAGVLV